MFYTASDLIQRMNSAITNGHVDDNESSGYNNSGFELQRKLPDGSYRPADKSEIAAVDFQAKLKQVRSLVKCSTIFTWSAFAALNCLGLI
mmetsp:Transcript_17908/g.34795  ORF Transcript_17908/g.34795 Transcript_17908/m.34795 type:complete len:90 (-) Transcript_17908:24-293(-)